MLFPTLNFGLFFLGVFALAWSFAGRPMLRKAVLVAASYAFYAAWDWRFMALLLMVGWLMNMRSQLTGIATGDQAIFVRRDAFHETGGFPEIPLMEDIALSKRLKRLSRPLCLRERVETSGRRWERYGVLQTIYLMWRLRLAYFFGADPNELAQLYGQEHCFQISNADGGGLVVKISIPFRMAEPDELLSVKTNDG